MGKSTKLPIYKDKGFMKKGYWKVIRSNWKQHTKKIQKSYDNSELYDFDYDMYLFFTDCINTLFENLTDNYKSQKNIINDYDYCDYRLDYRHPKFNDDEWKIIFSRK